MKKFLAILLAALLMLSLVACGSEEKEEPSSEGEQQSDNVTESDRNLEEIAAETALGFGSYNGQPIVWRVLDIDTENKKVLLISKDCIDEVLFHESEPTEELTWESSDLRKWLGGDFYNTAFTDEEKIRILEVTNAADTNSESGTKGGNDTVDKVFILSASEMVKYFIDDADMASTFNGENFSYWTRTPGDNTQGYVCTYGDSNGGLYMTGNWATSTTVAFRPAIWVNLASE